MLYSILIWFLAFLVASFVAVGNGHEIVGAYDSEGESLKKSFFNPVWNNTTVKLSFLFILTVVMNAVMRQVSFSDFWWIVIGGLIPAGLMGVVVGIFCALAGWIGSKFSRKGAVGLSTLALYGQVFYLCWAFRSL